MKRLFIAVPVTLSPSLQENSNLLREHLQRDQITWVAPHLQHLTLRFLGKTPPQWIDPLQEAIQNCAQQATPFTLELNRLGLFGSRYAPKVIWYGFEEFTLFKNLFEILEPQLIKIGFEPNYGNFVPHISVGRIRKVENKKRFSEAITKLQPKETQTIHVDQLVLYQSKLHSDGPIYRKLATFPFAQ